MKALKLIGQLCYDSKLAELGGLMTMYPSEEVSIPRMDMYCEGYFGTHDGEWAGRREPGAVYFYLYIPIDEEEYWYRLVSELPDAYYVREKEGDIVALWKME